MGGIINGIGDLLGLGGGNSASFNANQIGAPEQRVAQQHALGGLDRSAGLYNMLAGQGGIQNQSNVFNQQQDFANQLAMQAQGGGPNPALAQLANTTGQNVSNQAALMAGQRGVGANPGLAARNIGQMGAQAQQGAVGQAAALRAQQQLAAQQALQNQQAMLGNLSTQQVGQQQGQAQAHLAGSLQNQEQVYGGLANQNKVNAGIAEQNAQTGAKGVSGFLGDVGKVIMKPFGLAEGGAVPSMPGHLSFVGQVLNGMNSGGMVPGQAQNQGDSYSNDVIPAMLSPKEIVLPRSVTLSDDAPDKAKAFVEAILSKKSLKRST